MNSSLGKWHLYENAKQSIVHESLFCIFTVSEKWKAKCDIIAANAFRTCYKTSENFLTKIQKKNNFGMKFNENRSTHKKHAHVKN
jgi:hypothetical protein